MRNWNRKKGSEIYWLNDTERIGEHIFSFDKKKQYNLFRDFPHALTESEVEKFVKHEPFWANFFKDALEVY